MKSRADRICRLFAAEEKALIDHWLYVTPAERQADFFNAGIAALVSKGLVPLPEAMPEDTEERLLRLVALWQEALQLPEAFAVLDALWLTEASKLRPGRPSLPPVIRK